MNAIEDCKIDAKSQDDVASHQRSWCHTAPWCVMCVMCCEERGARPETEQRGADLSRVAARAQGRVSPLSGNGCQCQCLPAVSVGNVPLTTAWGPSSLTLGGSVDSNQWQSLSRISAASRGLVTNSHCAPVIISNVVTMSLCHQSCGCKGGIRLAKSCLFENTRFVFNIGSWPLRDSRLFSQRLESVQSLWRWGCWPMWR